MRSPNRADAYMAVRDILTGCRPEERAKRDTVLRYIDDVGRDYTLAKAEIDTLNRSLGWLAEACVASTNTTGGPYSCPPGCEPYRCAASQCVPCWITAAHEATTPAAPERETT